MIRPPTTKRLTAAIHRLLNRQREHQIQLQLAALDSLIADLGEQPIANPDDPDSIQAQNRWLEEYRSLMHARNRLAYTPLSGV